MINMVFVFLWHQHSASQSLLLSQQMHSLFQSEKKNTYNKMLADHFSDIFGNSGPASDSDSEDSFLRRKPNKLCIHLQIIVKVIVLSLTIIIFKILRETHGSKQTILSIFYWKPRSKTNFLWSDKCFEVFFGNCFFIRYSVKKLFIR